MTTDAEGLARKKRVRAGHKASATRILGQISSTLEKAPPNADKLSLLKLTLTEKLDVLKALDAEIIEVTPEEGLEEEIGQSDEYKERLYEALTLINKALESNTTTAATPSAEARTSGLTGEKTGKVKLPKLSLPHFNGDLTKWTTFWDSYESTIHENRDLTDVEKFSYLRSLLERSAHDAIAGLTLSSANYREAVDLLRKRFGNKQQIISKHMELLLKVDAVPDQNLRSLRRLYDTVESHIRSLRSLGIDSGSYGALLCPVLLNKLPQDVRLVISRSVTSTELDMDRLLHAFEEELQARERTADSTSSQRRQPSRNQPPSLTSALVSQTQQPSSGITCCYCEQPHSSNNCTSVTSVSARKQILKTSGRCFNCLRKGHLGRQCRSPGRCQRCKAKHHTSICELAESKGDSQPPPTVAAAKASTNTSTTLNPDAPLYTPTASNHANCSDKRRTVLLQTARCVLYNPSNPIVSLEARLMFDTGSQKSYITERARNLLSLDANEVQHLSIATFGSTSEQTKVCPIVHVGMQLRECPSMNLSLYVVPTICEPLASQPITASATQNPSFIELDLADNADGASSLCIDLLIGSDYYWDLVTGGIRRGNGGLTAIHTKLGWVLSGPAPGQDSAKCLTNLTTTHVLRADTQISHTTDLDAQLRAFWELESLGIPKEEVSVYEAFSNNISYRDGRYKVSLPWKEFHEPLPDNYYLSVKRLRGLLRRLSQDPEILKEYDSSIRRQLSEGIVETVDMREPCTNQIHYLPHHAVIRRDKPTTKLRIVYDASAKSDGPSLNECLHKGPSFNQLILDLLLRFRSYGVALMADVEKAFLMISVCDSDRDVLRFLWVDDINKKEPELRVFRFTRVVFGVSSSPFLLNATIKFHLERYMESDASTVQKLLQSTYVDDIITGAESEEAAFDLYTRSKDIFRAGGFNLRKFVTSSSNLQHQISCAEGIQQPETVQKLSYSDETYAKTTLGAPSVGELGNHKILGVSWNPREDCLSFDVSDLAQLAYNLQPTKRNIVSLIGRFYDPLGFLAPVTIRFKIFFQKLCQPKMDWDSPLPDFLAKEWRDLVSVLSGGVLINIPRSYFNDVKEDPASTTLCGFCDASKHAYAAVVYLKTGTSTGASVKFVVSKTRVAPLQTQSIPRLELLSAFLLSKLIVSVTNSLKANIPNLSIRCYTDSLVTLYWIRGTHKEWKVFVQNRVNEIRQNVHPTLWSHTPGKTNPADLPSRGLTMLELSMNRLWREGPEWLKQISETSHLESGTDVMPEECARELKAATKSLNLMTVEHRSTIDELMNCQTYSTYPKLLRITAQVLRAVKRFKTGISDTTTTVTPEELAEAETLWIISAQQQFSNDKNFQHQQAKLRLFQDNRGLWRCGGRLSNAEVSYTVKHPILLPRTHPLTSLIVMEAHRRVFHNGVKETLAETRRRFWILKGRSLTRSLLRRCVLCRRFEGTPFKTPPPPPLPSFRVKEDPAFSYTGVDFAGPLSVQAPTTTDQKVWICLYTCFVTRAVHLDAVPDMSTQTFIRCLKRFAARRGLPRRFISDNGKTFKCAAKYLRRVLGDATVKEHLAGMGSEWIFNLERAPWWGGAFERMVKSTKRCLRKTIGRAHFSMDELLTALAEIEAVINSRPLSYLSAEDVEEPLTPSHLLVGRRILNLPDHLGYIDNPDDEEFAVDPTTLTRRMRHLNTTLNHFWTRWRTEYLGELREAHYHSMPGTSNGDLTSITAGDVVIVHDEHLPRGLWKLGLVKDTIQGRDGEIRGATVRMAARDNQQEVLRRPIQLLYPLEVHQGARMETGAGDQESSTATPHCAQSSPKNTESSSTPLRRSSRAAAQRTDDRRRACIYQLQDDYD